jgi:Ca2+-binding EF-hand superfamily protein
MYSDGSGSIDREEFLQIPQIATNPLAGRMIAIFDEECVPKTISPYIYNLANIVEVVRSISKNLLGD